MGWLGGKIAMIAGATSGIGLRTAEVFVAEGAKIVIAGRRIPEGEAARGKRSIRARGESRRRSRQGGQSEACPRIVSHITDRFTYIDRWWARREERAPLPVLRRRRMVRQNDPSATGRNACSNC